MSAKRWTVRLYWRSSQQAQEDTNLDPTDAAMLRAVLERMVKAKHKTLNTDLSQWSITVHTLGGGRIVARCRVSQSGATEVTR